MYFRFGFVYVKLNMAVSLDPSFFEDALLSKCYGLFKRDLSQRAAIVKIFSAIINLTLGHPYAILLSDYPRDNHTSRVRRG